MKQANQLLEGQYYISKESNIVYKLIKVWDSSRYVLLRTEIDGGEHQVRFSELEERFINVGLFVATNIVTIQKQLIKIEKQLEKNRGSSFIDGWQTKKHSRKSRNWDYFAQEKMKLKEKYDNIIGIVLTQHKIDELS